MIRGILRRRPQAAALVVTLVTSATLGAAPPASPSAPASLAERLPAAVAEAQKAVEKVRGVAFRAPVASALLPEKELGPVLEAKLTEDLPAPFEAYAASLAAVGLVDPVPDLLKRIGNLYTRQVVGFYDPAQKKFYVVPERARLGGNPLEEHLRHHDGRLPFHQQAEDLQPPGIADGAQNVRHLAGVGLEIGSVERRSGGIHQHSLNQ